MGQIIKTISISKEEEQFLIDNNISPTRLIRNKIQEMMKWQRENGNNKELLDKIAKLSKRLQQHADFLEKRGLTDDYFAE